MHIGITATAFLFSIIMSVDVRSLTGRKYFKWDIPLWERYIETGKTPSITTLKNTYICRSLKINYYQCLTDGVNRQTTSSSFETHTGHMHIPIHLPKLSERQGRVGGWLEGCSRRGMTMGWTTRRDWKEMQGSKRRKHTKKKMQEGIFIDRLNLMCACAKITTSCQNLTRFRCWYLCNCMFNKWTDAAGFSTCIALISLEQTLLCVS
jgi:hypothetical protein